MCADTKLVPSWLVGSRDAVDAEVFMRELALRLRNRVQLTTDGHRAYLSAVESAFGADIDYAMLHKFTALLKAPWMSGGTAPLCAPASTYAPS